MIRERVGEIKIKEEGGGRKKGNKREDQEGRNRERERIRMIEKESKRDGERVKQRTFVREKDDDSKEV